ncbi:TlpA family protein disulfide reductase [Tissierella praeacuta]|uniref:TlpA family protein disulfide reductase n=1 Tax=Tissierella praeacuta TaxID=43131 RepID=UPI001C0FF58C|nr:TlpA disulfide reductase family protein [Tissierella praeacuta]MBU5255303.1 TlpA family protein disulfide reductase [Tissierella praeacuta]
MGKRLYKILFLILSMTVVLSLTACGNSDNYGSNLELDNGKFPSFKGEDFEGNEYSEELFKNNAVTVLNLWFTGCKACVQEMSELEKLSKEWEKKNVKLVGICVDGGTKEADKEAMKILKANNVTFPNLKIGKGEAIDKFMNSVMAFPTTLLIDRQGNVIGEPITGSIDTQSQIDDLNKKIDEIMEKDLQ